MVMSFSDWRDFHPLAAIERFNAATLFDLTDFFASNVLLPAGALLTSLLAGWRLDHARIAGDLGATPALGRAMLVLLRFVCPIAIVAVLAGAL
jgi:NSS family neurotransmitter:Na+ symporter